MEFRIEVHATHVNHHHSSPTALCADNQFVFQSECAEDFNAAMSAIDVDGEICLMLSNMRLGCLRFDEDNEWIFVAKTKGDSVFRDQIFLFRF